jgi:hypothetical protein
LTVAVRLAAVALDTVRPVGPLRGPLIDSLDRRLEEYFLRNALAISAINRSRGVRSIWVGQLLNSARLTTDEPGSWMPLVRRRALWPLQERLNELLRRTVVEAGDVYGELEIGKFEDSDFADIIHFSAKGSNKFAEMLAPMVSLNCTKNNE